MIENDDVYKTLKEVTSEKEAKFLSELIENLCEIEDDFELYGVKRRTF